MMNENIVVAIIAVLGTLLGAAIGGFAVWWSQREQIRHQERTLFYASKLDALTRFLSGMNEYYSNAINGTPIELDGQAYRDAATVAVLLCSKETGVTIAAFGEALPQVGQVVTDPAARNDLTAKYLALQRALRRELGQE